jgi:hypothetical protein
MKTSTSLGFAFGVIVFAVALLFFEAALLQLILTWFSINFSIWQTLTMVALANLIFKNNSVSCK